MISDLVLDFAGAPRHRKIFISVHFGRAGLLTLFTEKQNNRNARSEWIVDVGDPARPWIADGWERELETALVDEERMGVLEASMAVADFRQASYSLPELAEAAVTEMDSCGDLFVHAAVRRLVYALLAMGVHVEVTRRGANLSPWDVAQFNKMVNELARALALD